LIDLGRGLKSTAAGRYQLLYRYWLAYCTLLKRSDFTPETQDLIAIQQIKERRALADIEAGRIRTAITKVKNIWASLPGAGYGQHENDLDRLLSAYLRFGGLLAQENV
jgi:muramidase (phage lysozyme)